MADDLRYAGSAVSKRGVDAPRHRNQVRFATRGWEFWAVIGFVAVGWLITISAAWALPNALGAVAYASGVTAFFGVLAWRWVACRVAIAPDHVLIENLLRRFRVPRDQVERFEFDQLESKAVAVLKNGRRVVCYGVQQTNLRRTGGPARRMTDEMNAALREAQRPAAASV